MHTICNNVIYICRANVVSEATSSSESSPGELPLKVLHIVMTLGIVRGLSFCIVLQTTQVVQLWGEGNR